MQMLTMLREFTVKEVDRRIAECDNIWLVYGCDTCTLFIAHCCNSVRLPPNTEAHKEWTSYKDNMKSTVEQYKVRNLIAV